MPDTSTRQHVNTSTLISRRRTGDSRQSALARILRAHERGVAMLLVLVCLATATIATTAYLTSRDNSALIGENVAEAAAARWAASSGLDAAIVTLQTDWDWRTLHVNGTLFSGVVIAGAEVRVDVTDLLTDEAPTETSTYVTVTATAVSGSAEQTASALVHVPGLLDEALVLDLSEFAVFSSGEFELRDSGVLMRWPRSPLAILGSRVAIGGTATSSANILIRNAAAAIDVTAYTPPTASSTLVSLLSGPEIQIVELPDDLPYPAPPLLDGVEDITIPTPPNYTLPSGTFLVSEDSRFNNMELKNSAQMHFEGDITVVLEGDLDINTGAKLIIDGNVTLIVFGKLLMDNGAIELRAGTSLTAFVRGDVLASYAVDLRDSYIGDVRTDSVRDASGEAPWMEPGRIRFYSVENLLADANWRLRGNSVFKGEIYAPDAGGLVIEGTSAVYGRVASSDVRVRNDSGIFYCHTLKPYHGFTNLDGALYDEDGRLKDEFKLISSLNALVLETLAAGTRTVIRLGNELIGDEDDLVSDESSGVSVGSVSLGGTVSRLERRLK